MNVKKRLLACFATLFMTAGQVQGTLISTTEGTQFLYLTTGPEENGGGDSGDDRTGDLGDEADIALWEYDFVAAAGLVISFDYNVLTSEISGGVPDPFEVLLNGVPILMGAIGDANGTFPAVTGFDGVSILGPDGSTFFDGQLGFATASGITVAGTNTLEFFIGDDDDDIVDSALLVDAIQLDGSLLEGFELESPDSLPNGGSVLAGFVAVQSNVDFTAAVPEPTSLAFLSMGALGMAGRRRGRQQA